MKITATHIAYLHTCARKLWLFHHGVQMETGSELVYEGRLIGQTSYGERASRDSQLEMNVSREELQLQGVIDYFDTRAGIVHETKKSDKMEEAHVAQVKFYLYLLRCNGVEDARGIIEYPRLRQRTEVPPLDEQDREEVEGWIARVRQIVEQPVCPPVIREAVCKRCSYFEYCYSE